MSLSGLMDQYVKEKSLSEATIKTYEGVVNRFVIDTKTQYLNDITFDSALDWRSQILQRANDTT
jgi:hypothetical protein